MQIYKINPNKTGFCINFGDYIQLYTIYIKQKPDND